MYVVLNVSGMGNHMCCDSSEEGPGVSGGGCLQERAFELDPQGQKGLDGWEGAGKVCRPGICGGPGERLRFALETGM